MKVGCHCFGHNHLPMPVTREKYDTAQVPPTTKYNINIKVAAQIIVYSALLQFKKNIMYATKTLHKSSGCIFKRAEYSASNTHNVNTSFFSVTVAFAASMTNNAIPCRQLELAMKRHSRQLSLKRVRRVLCITSYVKRILEITGGTLRQSNARVKMYSFVELRCINRM